MESESQLKIKSVNELKREVTYVVYEPNVKDTQGEWASEETIRKGYESHKRAYGNGQGKENLFHSRDEETKKVNSTESFEIIESFIMPVDGFVGSEKVTKGTWLMTIKFHSDELWEAFSKKEVGGLSLGALARMRDM